ncbi:hypothetical protein H2201_008805 [Coniosporium apollinis]|uniref:DUF7924 domain-containing protein n=1 Tax=Coniosporium apollinis TaxID=61459 RepID=A0ABQ9NFU9_9PEZI|nr:hypothetical protein H2201_008805 [Coniosporium apollinis]
MARTHLPAGTRRLRGNSLLTVARGERPAGVRKEARPLRRSARLRPLFTHLQAQDLLDSQKNDDPDTQPRPSPTSAQVADRKRKRSRDIDAPSKNNWDRPLRKRRRASPTATEDAHEETATGSVDSSNPVDYWRKHQRWPRKYFESEGSMSRLLARKKSTSTLRRRSSATSVTSSDTTPSDQKPREAKSALYKDARYEALLAAKNSFMGKHELDVKGETKQLCRDLLQAEQTVPEDSLFSDDLFEETCEAIRNRNEARVIRDIGLLIVPSAETLAIRRSRHLKILAESVNEGWNNSIPITQTRPQPDYAVGFGRSAFTPDQLKRLEPFVGDLMDASFFMATYYMYFPFLTCEVKCGAAALDVADRQNAHSMTLAVRAVVELFRLVNREKEIDREILAFSVSHDHSTVRIYGHYPVINGNDTKYYRHPIRNFGLTDQEGKERWAAYKFTKNVYDNWMPVHFKLLCSAIDEIPLDVNFDVSQQSELQFSGESGLSQELESHHLSQSEEPASLAGHDDRSSIVDAENATPDTSVTHSFKRPKRKH